MMVSVLSQRFRLSKYFFINAFYQKIQIVSKSTKNNVNQKIVNKISNDRIALQNDEIMKTAQIYLAVFKRCLSLNDSTHPLCLIFNGVQKIFLFLYPYIVFVSYKPTMTVLCAFFPYEVNVISSDAMFGSLHRTKDSAFYFL